MLKQLKPLVLALVLIAALVLPAEALHEKTVEDRIDLLSSRVETLEKKKVPPVIDWIENVTLGGLIEVEGSYSAYDPAGSGPSTEASDIVLSTMELGLDAALNDRMGGHILILWEEDETEPVDLDEAFVSVSGGGRYPVYLHAGKFYIPFGAFESRFISDPMTLELGETRESAFLLGCHAGMVDMNAGAFNGDVDEADQDDHIESFFGSASITTPESLIPGIAIGAGVSYISNIADSDLLSEEIAAPDGIRDYAGGLSGFVSASAIDRIFFIAEYVGALEKFADGEFAFGAGPLKPTAWNVEMAYLFENGCGLGAKYEGTDDCGELLPETRYGAIAFRQFSDSLFFGMEYLDEKFENDDKNRVVTAQLAYTF